jgi:hypothetical protein
MCCGNGRTVENRFSRTSRAEVGLATYAARTPGCGADRFRCTDSGRDGYGKGVDRPSDPQPERRRDLSGQWCHASAVDKTVTWAGGVTVSSLAAHRRRQGASNLHVLTDNLQDDGGDGNPRPPRPTMLPSRKLNAGRRFRIFTVELTMPRPMLCTRTISSTNSNIRVRARRVLSSR